MAEMFQQKEPRFKPSKDSATTKRPDNLDKLYHALITIKPTSVDSKWAFSAMELFVTKLRNRLNAENML